MLKRRYIVTTGVLGLCLTLTTACGGGGSGGTAKATPKATASGTGKAAAVPSGFKRVGSAANGVTAAVPRAWTAVDLTKGDLEKILARTGLSGSALAQAKAGMQTLVSAKAVWAFDAKSAGTSPSGFTTNLNGFCQPSAGASANQLIRFAKAQLAQINAKVSEASEVPVDAGHAVRIVYTFTIAGAEVKGTQYYVPGKGKTCTVTLSTDRDGRQALFDKIGRTVRPI